MSDFGLAQRQHGTEVMDDPSLDTGPHFQALQGLARINRWSGSAKIVWDPIAALARRTGQHSLRVLDIATGAGDIPILLSQMARQAGLSLQIEGCDKSPQAIAYARKRAEHATATGHCSPPLQQWRETYDVPVRFFTQDVIGGEMPSGYDILVCSLFLHHLENQEALHLLRSMAKAAGQMILVNDLLRCTRGLALAYLGTRILSRSWVVHTDGVLSVRAAFNMQEVRALAQQAGLKDACVQPRWPSRFLLRWERQS